jgi:hypothetical protein
MASDRGHINQALTNYTAGVAKNLDQQFIADQVAPPIPVPSMSDAYWVMGDDSMRADGDIISLTADVPRVSFSWSDDAYSVKEYGYESVLSKAKLANADGGMGLLRTTSAGLVRKIKLELEIRVAAAYAAMSNTSALAAADRWDSDTSDPVGQSQSSLETIRGLIGVQPNTLIIGAHVYSHLRLHPAITSRLAGLVAGTAASDAQIATALGVDRVIVGRAVKITSKEGAASKTKADVWGKVAVFCYIDPSNDVAAGNITPVQRFAYTGFMPEFGTYEYDEGALKRVLGVYAAYDLKTVAASAAYLYTTVTA